MLLTECFLGSEFDATINYNALIILSARTTMSKVDYLITQKLELVFTI